MPFIFILYRRRNLLITQKTEENSTELVFINIYEDLIFPFKNKKYINYNIDKNSKNVTKNLIPFKNGNPILLEQLYYLKKNEIFLLCTNDFIYLINPKIPIYNLSLKMSGKKRNIYTDICKNYCENPEEKMGESLLKIFWKKQINVPLRKLLTFSFVDNIFGNENGNRYSSTDWFIILDINNEIHSYSINQIFLSVRRKDINASLPQKDSEQLYARLGRIYVI